MSVVFSSQSNDKKSKNGYFRIGNVTLDIPPTSIITDKIVNNNRKQTLRGKNEMFSKSGQSRWDVTITWIAMKDSAAADENVQYYKVQTILAMFKAAPFVEVENAHIRQILAKAGATTKSQRMAFGLRQFKIDTHPDIVDAVICTLTMTYFNYAPYSLQFNYVGDSGQATDAYKSPSFDSYLSSWMEYNLVSDDPAHQPPLWENQEHGKLGFTWRRYEAAVVPSPVLTAGNTATNPAPSTQTTTPLTNPNPANANKNTTGLSAANLALINTLNPTAAAQATAWLSDVQKKGYNFTITSAFRSQAQQNVLYAAYQAAGGDAARKAHLPGAPKYPVAKVSQHTSGLCLDIVFNKYPGAPPQYAQDSAGNYGWSWILGMEDSVHWKYTGTIKTPTPKNEIMSNSATLNTDGTETYKNLNDLTSITQQMQDLLVQKYQFDYLIENSAFFFKQQDIILRDKEHENKPHAQGLHPAQISVLFINNLAQIPLAGYQYPTYQHIGPAASLISIQMTSVGTSTGDSDPVHAGLGQLTEMTDQLEDQFIRLRPIFRSVKSIHGMQAIFVENAVLNMLGIFAIMPEQVSTETIQDSANMVQVTFTGYQYENIFEETPPYKINGITGSISTGLQNIISNNIDKTITPLSKLTAQEQSQLNKVVKFQSDYQSSNVPNLGGWILDAASSKNTGNFIVSFSNNPTIALSSQQVTDITTILNGLGSSYPGLTVRTPSISSSNSCTYADLIAINSISSSYTSGNGDGSVNDAASAALSINNLVQGQTSNSNNIQSIYLQLLPFVGTADSVFASQLQKLINSPTYKSQFSNAANPSNNNPGHGAYLDLGLPDPVNPASYFIDDNATYKQIVKNELTQTVGSQQSISATINTTSTQVSGPNSNSATVNTSSSGIPTDANKLAQMCNVPGYSMAEAFPTFKLFFIEDANNGIYYCFDNFYSYASVLDIEVMRPYDKPATAVIKMTNLSNLFNHKIYDNTTVGHFEQSLDKFTITDNSSELTTAPEGNATVYHDPVSGQTTMVGRDNREGFNAPYNQLIGLKYFPLQTGSKIQIRMGYDNDPDKLTVVFTGMVTEIEDVENDIGEIIVTAQSYLLELCTTSAQVATAGGSFINELFSDPTATYGGISPFTDGGDAQSVIRSLLRNAMAKHFGHWQLNVNQQDNLIKGFNAWQELAATVTTGAINNAISTGGDRSGENIMVNSYVDSTGTTVPGTGRSWFDQQNSTVGGAVFNLYSYSVDPTLDWSVWELIKDVSRRYPEYVLLEKFYGFPYEADATLVYGSPLDWYFTRPALIGDDEILKNADANNDLYIQWWQSQGKAKWDNIFDVQYRQIGSTPRTFSLGILSIIDEVILANQKPKLENQAGKSYADLQAVDAQMVANVTTVLSDNDSIKNLRAALSQLEAEYVGFVGTKSAPNAQINDGRIKPIRQYHFIDQTMIIHNGITVNGKMYNAVKIANPKSKEYFNMKAGSAIPDNHVRLLDVSDKINDISNNVLGSYNKLQNQYAQSFLKEEMSKMYRGEIILRGCPEIEPLDILILLDPSSSIVGPVEVEQVIHSFSQEMGYVTIVKPRMQIAINELTAANFSRGLGVSMAKAYAQLNNLMDSSGTSLAVSGGVTVAAGIAAVAAPEVTIPAIAVALLAGAGIYYIMDTKYATNPIVVQPLSRFGRPWVGGLEGFQITGIQGYLEQEWKNFVNEEWNPTLDAYKTAQHIVSNN